MKKVLIFVLIMCFVLTGCSKPSESNVNVEVSASELKTANSYEEIYDMLMTYLDDQEETREFYAVDEMVEEEVMLEEAPEEGSTTNGSSSSDYSGTNIQTQGVDEMDIVKTDGEYIYSFNGTDLKIIKPNGTEPEIISETELYEDNKEKSCYYDSLYLRGDHIIAIGTEYNNEDYIGYGAAAVYDVSDPMNVALVERFSQSGYISSTRMVGDILYMITDYQIWDFEEDEPSTYIPRLATDDTETLIAIDDICIPEEAASTSWLVVSAYDITNCTTLSTVSMLGSADDIYVSAENIYVADTKWVDEKSNEYTQDQYTVVDYLNYSQTQIHKFAYSEGDISYECTGAVKGSLLNQFSMDEHNGNLRVVTTNNDNSYRIYTDEKYDFENYEYLSDSMSNGLYVLDESLQVVGSVEDLGEDERVYSVRFDGDIGYFVTYRETDPLFAVELSVPENPTVLSALKINGFSQYLHTWNEDLLLGMGMEADENGNVSTMKLSMFDVSDPADVQETQKLVLPYYYSEGLYNHHAVFVDVERGLIGFGVDEGYVVYRYDDGFTQYEFIDDANFGYNIRGVRIGDYLYIVGMDDISVIDISR
ncbi:MAG: hypothetical protein E7456_03375 [Ruminococcaceae bacterium]|nr:hypothetical protein [Oscillospiraceae bacterium]